uniref:FHA domain-containing protein n=1 Tax=Acrobeloides nanus TaxID=290746 RepID=A0A914C3X9_9BILA
MNRARSRSRERDRSRHKRSRSRSAEGSYKRDRDRSPSNRYRKRSRDQERRSQSPMEQKRQNRSRSRDRTDRGKPDRDRTDRGKPDRDRTDQRKPDRDLTNRGKPDRDFKKEPVSPKSYKKNKDQQWGKPELYEKKEEEPVEKEKPSFEPSGKLAADTNTFKGVVIKYNEPPDAKLPKLRWRLYPFKGEEALPPIYIHRQSAYLVGRDRKIADFPVDHPSCSKQHAAFQYRSVTYERADGSKGRRTKPYLMDLGSGNGTYLNNERIEAQRYYELKEKDVVKFGFSSREYVVLHENSLNKAEGSLTDSEPEDEEPKSEDEIKKETVEED